SICARAIEGDDLLVLENLASDGPFQKHPFVVGASHFRFYAGAPITIRGFKFGTLCIADTKSRTFTTTDRRRLNRLAQMVVDHILYDEISNKARAENREYRAILEACQDAMLVLNADLEIVIENTASQELFGTADAVDVPQGLETRLPVELRENHCQELHQILAMNEAPGAVGEWHTTRGLRTDGSTFPMQMKVGRADLQHGPALVVLARDMSDAAAREAELQSAQMAAEAAALTRSRFLATVSHELRTPLNAIIGFADVMMTGMQGPLEPKHREYVQHVRDAGGLLLSLVNDIMDISAIDQGGRELSPEVLMAAPEFNAVHALLRKHAEKRGVGLIFETSDVGRQAGIWADARALKQILHNIVGNAIKFTNSGGTIRLALSATDQSVSFKVMDDGIGIDRQDLDRLGGLFVRGRNVTRMPAPGAGLGLSICYRLAQEMDANLTIESELDVGTTVTLTFDHVNAGQQHHA
ncbi:MAG: GAF domain-containing sensor histidine kinase, partial [Pseudomonadota bacterium]